MSPIVLKASAERATRPNLFRLTAKIEVAKAIGALENNRLGPSHASGWFQRKALLIPNPTRGIVLRSNAAIGSVVAKRKSVVSMRKFLQISLAPA